MRKNKLILWTLFGLIGFSVIQAQETEQISTEQYNPEYHFYPSGDPTGLYYYDGYYYNNWGVARSKDFVHWKFTDYGKRWNSSRKILANPSVSERKKDSVGQSHTRLGGSGTIIYDKLNSSVLGSKENPPFVSLWHNQTAPWNNQVIGLAYSLDTVKSWQPYEKFPILDINSREFRDPKVFWYEPTQKWIMAIGWADVPKIKFFESDNLIDWKFLSDFGPWGARAGVWECVDLFELPVDGNLENTKWVLTISVQPLSGQYFIGDFDGKRFILDESFKEDLENIDNSVEGEVIFDFEQGLDDWEMEGEAFLESPADRALYLQSAVMGIQDDFFINSFNNQAKSTGKLISPGFKIEKDHINFLVGGGYYPGKESVNLHIDGKVVRSQSGNHSGGLQWKSWNVSEYKERKAKIGIVDLMEDQAGYIYADHFMQSDAAAAREREKAFWFDYGPDFFAARAWNNYDANEDRIIWTGWMGSWRYAGSEPVRGLQAVPRSLELKTFPEGVRLIQKPVEELKNLRGSHKTQKAKSLVGNWQPTAVQPSDNSYELEVSFENVNASEFGLKLAVGKDQETVIGYDVEKEELYVDRTRSGKDDFSGLFPQKNSGPMGNKGIIKLHIFVDHSSIEVFGNNGETVISSKIYPDTGSTGMEFFSKGGKWK